MSEMNIESTNIFLLYATEEGDVKVDVLLKDEASG